MSACKYTNNSVFVIKISYLFKNCLLFIKFFKWYSEYFAVYDYAHIDGVGLMGALIMWRHSDGMDIVRLFKNFYSRIFL